MVGKILKTLKLLRKRMIRRPLDPRFSEKVKDGIKCTTIRDNPWPLNVPIMLYNWTGKPYRSKQRNVAAIKVFGYCRIKIERSEDGAMMTYSYGDFRGNELQDPLWMCEGFDSLKDMSDWFRPLVNKGQSINKTLMAFCLLNNRN